MCRRGLWLKDGTLHADGPIRDVLRSYRGSIEETAIDFPHDGDLVTVHKLEVTGPDGRTPVSHEPMELSVVLKTGQRCRGRFYLGVSEGPGTPIFIVSTEMLLAPGTTRVTCRLESVPLPKGHYYTWASMEAVDDTKLLPWSPVAPFDVFGPDLDWAPIGTVRLSPVHVLSTWEHHEG